MSSVSRKHRRKKKRTRPATGDAATQVQAGESTTLAVSSVRVRTSPRPSLQNAAFASMLTLGCLGLAVFFAFFYTEDANHLLYGGVMGLTAVGWLIITTRRWSAYRRQART